MYPGQITLKGEYDGQKQLHQSRMMRLNSAVMHVAAGVAMISTLSDDIVGPMPQTGSGAMATPTPSSFIGMMDEQIDMLNKLGDQLLSRGTAIKEAL